MKLRQVKETEISRLSTQLCEQQAQHAGMVRELTKMLKYSHYLEDVLQHEAEFGEIADIISRWERCLGQGYGGRSTGGHSRPRLSSVHSSHPQRGLACLPSPAGLPLLACHQIFNPPSPQPDLRRPTQP